MNFDFDDTQHALRDLARDLFTRESPPARVRDVLNGKPLDRRLWKTMAEAGLLGIAVPEEFGGAGGDELDMTLVLEEAGRAALPDPLLATAAIAAPLIAKHGSHELRERWLPAIAAGDAIVVVRESPSSAADDVPDAELILAVEDAEVVVMEGGGRTALGGEDAMLMLFARGFFGTAAVLNGVAMKLLAMTVDYVKERTQFGRPVGSFQAVKHKLASMHVAIESSRPATWYAAYALASGAADASIDACVAKIAANDAEAFCNREALQCHGGIGFTWEHDLHLWLKQGIALRRMFGRSHELRRNLMKVHRLEELIS